MKVLFTGATGVLGRAAVPLLVDQGHEVSALARAEEDRSRLEGIGARPVAVDLFDPEQVETAVKDVETVIHFATAIPALDSMPKREAWVTNDRLRSEAQRERESSPPTGFLWWALQGSNLRPLPCEGSALPLS